MLTVIFLLMLISCLVVHLHPPGQLISRSSCAPFFIGKLDVQTGFIYSLLISGNDANQNPQISLSYIDEVLASRQGFFLG
jgi:hypothetical protein